jgi:Uma2 family endonuclease
MPVEIVSPSSIHRGSHVKFELYERCGVGEYWLVYPSSKTVNVFPLTDVKYELISEVIEQGMVKSSLLKGLEIEIAVLLSD